MTAVPMSSAAVATVEPAVSVLSGVHALAPDSSVCGPAATCRCAPRDNLALHRLLASAAPGSVLVCDAGGRQDAGHFGELMALAARSRGLAGLVIDGAVRDGAALLASGFPVFHRGLAPHGCTKSEAPSVGEPVVLAGTVVAPGDVVVADFDGVVVVPAETWPRVVAEAEALEEDEAEIREALARGERLAEVLGLEGLA